MISPVGFVDHLVKTMILFDRSIDFPCSIDFETSPTGKQAKNRIHYSKSILFKEDELTDVRVAVILAVNSTEHCKICTKIAC